MKPKNILQILGVITFLTIAACLGNKVKGATPPPYANSIQVWDQVQFNAASRLAEISPISYITIECSDMKIDSMLYITHNAVAKRVFYVAKSCKVWTTNPIIHCMIGRFAKDSAEANKMTDCAIYMQGFDVRGCPDNNGHGHGIGIELDCLVSGGLEACYADNLDSGFVHRDCINFFDLSCQTLQCDYGFMAICGNWMGADQHSTGSNIFRREMCLARNRAGNGCGFTYIGCSCGEDVQCGSEAGDNLHGFNYVGTNWAKGYSNIDCYGENNHIAGGSFINVAIVDGFFHYQKKWEQPTKNLIVGNNNAVWIDASQSKGGIINFDMPCVIPPSAKFKCGVNEDWTFNLLPVNIMQASYWVGGKMPASYCGTVYQGGVYNFVYKGNQLRFNGFTFDSLAVRAVVKALDVKYRNK